MTGITGILLAAGSATRFGSDKRQAMLPGHPQCLLITSWQRLNSHCERCLVVLRPGDDTLAEQLKPLGVHTLIADEAAFGMGHSLAAAVNASPDASGWLIALADMPLIDASSYASVHHTLNSGASIARPRYQGHPGHPVAFSRTWKTSLSHLCGDEGARQLVKQHKENVTYCDVDDPYVLRDIDTPKDLSTYPLGPTHNALP